MSPEMLSKSGHGYALDLYSLGVLLFEMLTGLTPHYSLNRQEMYYQILNNPVSIPSYISWKARSLLEGLLQKDPKQRFGRRGIWEIKRHPYLADIDWHKLLKRNIPSPFKPNIETSNFDEEYTSMTINWSEDDSLSEGEGSNLSNKKTFSIDSEDKEGYTKLFPEYTFNKNIDSKVLLKDTVQNDSGKSKLKGKIFTEGIHPGLSSCSSTRAPKFIKDIDIKEKEVKTRDISSRCNTHRGSKGRLETETREEKREGEKDSGALNSSYNIVERNNLVGEENEASKPLPSITRDLNISFFACNQVVQKDETESESLPLEKTCANYNGLKSILPSSTKQSELRIRAKAKIISESKAYTIPDTRLSSKDHSVLEANISKTPTKPTCNF